MKHNCQSVGFSVVFSWKILDQPVLSEIVAHATISPHLNAPLNMTVVLLTILY